MKQITGVYTSPRTALGGRRFPGLRSLFFLPDTGRTAESFPATGLCRSTLFPGGKR